MHGCDRNLDNTLMAETGTKTLLLEKCWVPFKLGATLAGVFT